MKDELRDALESAIGFQYEIIGLLGRGGMGAVYHAHEKALDRPVAIKVLPPDAVGGDARERFLREARTAARLTHPNIVPLFTFGETQGLVYYVMGYVDGESLEQRLRRGALDAETAKSLLAQLANALDYAHQQGIVHRDVKPDNVLIERGTGVAKLTDFGIAKRASAGETLTGTGLLMGTPKYMSPEQAAGDRDLDARSDIYALGLVGYAMVAGRPPFDGGSVQEILTQQVTRDAPSLRKLFPDLESSLVITIDRALRKEPAQRWPTAGTMASTLRDEDAEELEAVQPRTVRAGTYAVATSVSVLVALNAGWWVASRTDSPFLVLFFPFLMLFGIGADYASLRWRARKSAAEIRRVFTEPPRWWPLWWPARWRRRDDVWDRLPVTLKRTRIVLTVGMLGFLVTLEAVFAILAIGIKSPLAIPTLVIGLGVAFVGMLGSVVAHMVWGRRHGLTRYQSDRLAGAPTAHPRLWKQPWAARVLEGDPVDSARMEPATARELAGAIAEELPLLPAAIREAMPDVRAAADALVSAIDVLDGEIATISRSVDHAEIERLEARIAALDMRSVPGREMHQLYSSQLDLLKRLARQAQELSTQRARYLELLRTMWRQLTTLRAENAAEQVRIQDLTARIRHIAASIGDQLGRGHDLPDMPSGVLGGVKEQT